MIRCSSVFGSAPVANPGIKIRSAARASLMFSGLTFRAERLRPAAQLMQNKLADWRAEVRSSAELGGQACSLRQIFADQLAKLASGLRTEVSLRKNLEFATSHED